MSDGPEHIRNESQVAEPVVEPVFPEPVFPEPEVAQPLVAPPLVAQSPVVEPLVVEPAVVAPAVAAPAVVAPMATAVPVAATSGTVRTSYTRSFAPDAIVAAIVGLFVMLVGLLAITRGGFDGSMDTPVVSVLDFTHTTLLGLIEIVIGGCLLISGATRSRSAALFFGSVLGIAAFVGAVQSESFDRNLALESSFAWLLVFAAVVVVVAALLLPRYMQRSTVVHPI